MSAGGTLAEKTNERIRNSQPVSRNGNQHRPAVPQRAGKSPAVDRGGSHRVGTVAPRMIVAMVAHESGPFTACDHVHAVFAPVVVYACVAEPNASRPVTADE